MSISELRKGLSWFRSFVVSGGTEPAVLGAIFVCAAVLRIAFVVGHPPPFTWMRGWVGDENAYFDAAENALGVLTRETGPTGLVSWLALKGPIYPLFLSVVYGVSGYSHSMVTFVQALMDASTCVLIYLIGKRIFGFRPALVAAGLATMYIPFIQATGNLLRETIGSFLLALMVLFLTKASGSPSRRGFLFAGILLGLNVLCNPAAGFLPFLLLVVPLVVVSRHASWTCRMHIVGVFLLGVALIIGPWMISTTATIGRPLLSASATGVLGTGGFLNFVDSDGWVATRGGGAFVREAGSILSQADEEYDREDFDEAMSSLGFRLRVAIALIRNRPLPSLVSVPLENFYRLWTFPYNTFRYSFLFTYAQQVIYHRLIVCTALLGIPLSLVREWKRSLAMILVLAYFSLSWPLVHIEVRHNMALMPYMMIAAGGALGFLVSVGRGSRGSLHRTRILVALVTSNCLGLIFLIATLPLLSLVLGQVPTLSIYHVTILARNGLLLSLAGLLYLLARVRLDRKTGAFVSLFPIVVLLVGYNTQALTSKTWHGWTTRLSEPGQRVRQEITLPQEDLKLFWWSEGALLIDMRGGPGKEYDLVVEVNGEQVMQYRDGLQVPSDKFARYHEVFYRQRLRVQEREAGDLPQWFEIPVDKSLFASRDPIVVEVYLASKSRGSGNYVDIYGDYAWTEDRTFEGPCFGVRPWETSIYRYIYDDEFRLDCDIALHSLESSGALFDGASWAYHDLAPAPGTQSGELRIRLQLRKGTHTKTF